MMRKTKKDSLLHTSNPDCRIDLKSYIFITTMIKIPFKYKLVRQKHNSVILNLETTYHHYTEDEILMERQIKINWISTLFTSKKSVNHPAHSSIPQIASVVFTPKKIEPPALILYTIPYWQPESSLPFSLNLQEFEFSKEKFYLANACSRERMRTNRY